MFNLDEVYDWVAAIAMTGLDVRTLDNVQIDSIFRGTSVFQPDITKQVVMTNLIRDSFGDGDTAKMTLHYSVPYVLLYKPVGSDRNINFHTPQVVALLKVAFAGIIQNDNPATTDGVTVDLVPSSISFGRTVIDPSGGQWHGGEMIINVTEYIN